MFRLTWTVALVVLTALGSLTLAAVQESKEVGGKTTSPPKELTVDLGGGVKLEMVLIPAGEFLMGSPDSDKDALGWEKPQHRVRITKPFYLGKYLVTQEQWEAVMGNNPSCFKGPKNPVEQVSWNDCREFVEKLNVKLGGGKYSLPTEAQWEYARRAGSTTKYCFGDEDAGLGEYAWYDKNSGDETHPVGGKKPNAWGLYDVYGNACEWCADWYDGGYYTNSPTDDPTGPSTGSYRVFGSGSWGFPAWSCRSAWRTGDKPGYRRRDLGFRVCRGVVGKPTVAEKPITNSIGMKLVLIPAGEFLMGSPESDDDALSCEKPQHQVRITKPFYLGQYPVTLGEFLTFYHDANYKLEMERDREEDHGYDEKGEFVKSANLRPWAPGWKVEMNQPVVWVTWNDSTAFCKWLSRKESKTYRLPTEAEWEYACRAGSTTRYSFGDSESDLGDYAWYGHQGGTGTHSVGGKRRNAWGLYDMQGNVWQWCADWFDSQYYPESPNDPKGCPSGFSRVARGGSWLYVAKGCRAAFRAYGGAPEFRSCGLGFRVARDLAGQ